MMTITITILLSLLAFWCFVRFVTKQGFFESESQLLAREAFVREFPKRTVAVTRLLKAVNCVDIVSVEFFESGVISEPNEQEVYKVHIDDGEATRIETHEIDEFRLIFPK